MFFVRYILGIICREVYIAKISVLFAKLTLPFSLSAFASLLLRFPISLSLLHFSTCKFTKSAPQLTTRIHLNVYIYTIISDSDAYTTPRYTSNNIVYLREPTLTKTPRFLVGL